MKRRSFLRFMGLAPAVPVAALAASKVAEAAAVVPKTPVVEMYSNTVGRMDDDCSIAVFQSTVSWSDRPWVTPPNKGSK